MNSVQEHFNCAQQVAQRIAPSMVKQLTSCGGGSAPGSVCGALYAVQERFPKRRGNLEKEFDELVGNTTCYSIKDSGTSCSECVRVALELAERQK